MMTINEPGKNKPAGQALGLYIHIPFCLQRCSYCDFLTYAGIGEETIKAYVEALIRQVAIAAEHMGSKVGSEEQVAWEIDTIYIGGGTPSFIDKRYIGAIMEAVRENFSLLGEGLEITLEANPESLSAEKLKAYREVGVNRISMGVQSLNDTILKTLNRAHDRTTFLQKYMLARQAGFDNISLDLIFALPGQDLLIWEKDLREALALEPEHVSFYALQIEEGTAIKEMIESGKIREVGEEEDRAMYHKALKILDAAGYVHYEISNAARPAFQSRHNLKYWSMEDYLGLGLGAHSYLAGTRYENEKDLEKFLAASRWQDFSPWQHTNTREDEIAEYMFTGLRKTEGIDQADFEKRFAARPQTLFKLAIEKNLGAGLLQINGNHIKLTIKGMDLFNQVLLDFV